VKRKGKKGKAEDGIVMNRVGKKVASFPGGRKRDISDVRGGCQ
jgi:hypothetical protein